MMNDHEMIEAFLETFLCYRNAYDEHMEKYGELLQHVFYPEVITDPLIELLERETDTPVISTYTGFIERMWREGDESVRNVVDVTILERLSDDRKVWNRFGKYISDEFKNYINTEWIENNIAISGIDSLE
jgi:hypothetical protein